MGSALAKRSISAPVAPDATTETRGLTSLLPEAELEALLAQLLAGAPVVLPRSQKVIDLAMLGETLEYIFTQPMPVKAKWEFQQSPKLPLGSNVFVRQNGVGELEGVEKIPYSILSGAPITVPSLRERGAYTITGDASYPVGLASAAIGATQTGNGSGDSNTIRNGDYWKLTNAGDVGANNLAVSVDTLLIAAVDNPGQSDENWLIADKKVVAATEIYEDFTKGLGAIGLLGWNLEGGQASAKFSPTGKGVLLELGTGNYQNAYFYQTQNLFNLQNTKQVTVILSPEVITQIGFSVRLKKQGSSVYNGSNGINVGFWADDGTIGIESHDGTNNTVVNSGVVPVAGAYLKIDFFNDAGAIKVYINNVLKATLTTTLPTLNSNFFVFLGSSNGNDGLVKKVTFQSVYIKPV